MALRLGLEQSARPDLQLRLSPEILQRIEVLQLAAPDLAQLVEQELQENEALELDLDTSAPEPEPEADTEPGDDEDWGDLEEVARPAPREGVSQMEFMEATAQAVITLADHLLRQLDELDLSERERAACRAIVGALNERGWLAAPLEELEVELDPPARPGELEHCLHIVQRLEPPGVGARDLSECLLLQLDEEDPRYDLLVTLIVQHLDDIAHNRIPRIARETGAGIERVLDAIEAISHLDPIPGRRFGSSGVPYVRPDVVVQRIGDGYEIALESSGVPAVTLSRAFLDMASDRRLDPELRKHVRSKIESARSLVSAIEQRRNTLFRVSSELVNRQADFLEHGLSALRPLRMQELADALGVHVSTISRAIAGKYMQVPRGIVPMRALFTGEVPQRQGDEGKPAASRTSVKELVRDLVAEEDPSQPRSDEALVAILKERHGLDIARRTVTKYRKALGIGSSRARRRYGSP